MTYTGIAWCALYMLCITLQAAAAAEAEAGTGTEVPHVNTLSELEDTRLGELKVHLKENNISVQGSYDWTGFMTGFISRIYTTTTTTITITTTTITTTTNYYYYPL
jgi:hypothetical protein